MAEYIDRKKIKKSYYFQTKGGVFPKSELFVKRDDIFDMQPADVVEREKIDKAIEEIEQAICSYGFCFVSRGMNLALDILKKNIGENK